MSKKYKLFLKIHVLRYLFQARWNKHIHPVSPIEGNLDGMQTAIIWGLWKVAGGWGRLEFQVPPKRLSVHHYFFFSTSPGLSTLQHPKGNIGLQTGLHKSPSSGFTRRRRELPNAWRQCGKPLVCLLSFLCFIPSPSNAMVAGTKTASGSIRDQSEGRAPSSLASKDEIPEEWGSSLLHFILSPSSYC